MGLLSELFGQTRSRSRRQRQIKPLHTASYLGDKQGVLDALSSGADIDEGIEMDNKMSSTIQNVTALFLAAQRNHLEVIKVLLQHGANPALSVKCFDSKREKCSPAEIAALNGHPLTAMYLRKALKTWKKRRISAGLECSSIGSLASTSTHSTVLGRATLSPASPINDRKSHWVSTSPSAGQVPSQPTSPKDPDALADSQAASQPTSPKELGLLSDPQAPSLAQQASRPNLSEEPSVTSDPQAASQPISPADSCMAEGLNPDSQDVGPHEGQQGEGEQAHMTLEPEGFTHPSPSPFAQAETQKREQLQQQEHDQISLEQDQNAEVQQPPAQHQNRKLTSAQQEKVQRHRQRVQQQKQQEQQQQHDQDVQVQQPPVQHQNRKLTLGQQQKVQRHRERVQQQRKEQEERQEQERQRQEELHQQKQYMAEQRRLLMKKKNMQPNPLRSGSSHSNESFGNKSFGNKSFGSKSFGSKSFGNKSFGSNRSPAKAGSKNYSSTLRPAVSTQSSLASNESFGSMRFPAKAGVRSPSTLRPAVSTQSSLASNESFGSRRGPAKAGVKNPSTLRPAVSTMSSLSSNESLFGGRRGPTPTLQPDQDGNSESTPSAVPDGFDASGAPLTLPLPPKTENQNLPSHPPALQPAVSSMSSLSSDESLFGGKRGPAPTQQVQHGDQAGNPESVPYVVLDRVGSDGACICLPLPPPDGRPSRAPVFLQIPPHSSRNPTGSPVYQPALDRADLDGTVHLPLPPHIQSPMYQQLPPHSSRNPTGTPVYELWLPPLDRAESIGAHLQLPMPPLEDMEKGTVVYLPPKAGDNAAPVYLPLPPAGNQIDAQAEARAPLYLPLPPFPHDIPRHNMTYSPRCRDMTFSMT